MTEPPVDLGLGHILTFYGLAVDPDNQNPAYNDLVDESRSGAHIAHTRGDGRPCDGVTVPFNTPLANAMQPAANHWNVDSEVPLTLIEPVTCFCGDVGNIAGGVWNVISTT